MTLENLLNKIFSKIFGENVEDPFTGFMMWAYSKVPPIFAAEYNEFNLEELFKKTIVYPKNLEYEKRKDFYKLTKIIFYYEAKKRRWGVELSNEEPGFGWAVKIKRDGLTTRFSRGTEILISSGTEISSIGIVRAGRYGRFSNTELKDYIKNVINELDKISKIYGNS